MSFVSASSIYKEYYGFVFSVIHTLRKYSEKVQPFGDPSFFFSSIKPPIEGKINQKLHISSHAAVVAENIIAKPATYQI